MEDLHYFQAKIIQGKNLANAKFNFFKFNLTRSNNLGFGGVGGGLKNLGGNTGFQNTQTQGGMFSSQNTGFGGNTMTNTNNVNYNANDQVLKKMGIIMNRDQNNMHTDTIQDMKFIAMGNNNYKLLSVGWDKTLRLWNCQIQSKNPMTMGMGSNSPVKAECQISMAQKIDLKVYGLKLQHIPQMNSVLIVCGDCTIRRLNLANMQVDVMISLNTLALEIFFAPEINCFIVVTFDGKVLIYQTTNLQNPTKSVGLASTPSCADYVEGILLIGLADDMWSLVDTRIFNQNIQQLPSMKCNLESPITNVKINKPAMCIIATSCDGRIINSTFKSNNQNGMNVYVTPNDVNQCEKTFIFMGHGVSRNKGNKSKKGPNNAFNITSLNTNSRSQLFACTSSADSQVVFWDLTNKSKIRNLDFKEPISCGAISKDGNLGAFAIGYDWSKGIWGTHQAPQSIAIGTYIFVNNDLICPEVLKKKNK